MAEVIVAAPLATTAMDLALDAASGGAGGLLACGSGRKLKTAMTRAAGHSHTSALKQQKPPRAHPLSSIQKSFPNAKTNRDLCLLQNRYFNSLAPRETPDADSSSILRPHVFGHASVLNPRSPEACRLGAASWISDPGEFLPLLEREALQGMLDDLHLKTGSQCALVVLNDLAGRGTDLQGFRAFGTSLFNAWGVGSAEHNNGVLVLLFQEARRLEIVTGTGMSTALSDAWLAGMQQREMVPHFKAGNYAQGLRSGIEAMSQRLQSSAPEEWRNHENAEDPLAIGGATTPDARI